MTGISVLIVTKDQMSPLKKALESVLKQDHDDFEVIVLDDASDTLDVAEDILPDIAGHEKIIHDRSRQSLDITKARERLIKMATKEILVFLDDNAYFVSSFALHFIESTFNENMDAAILAPRIIFKGYSKADEKVPFNKFQLLLEPELVKTPRKVSYYIDSCHAIRRSMIEKCGGYFGLLTCGEEVLDLSYRVIEAGFTLNYDPSVVVFHVPKASLIEEKEKKHKKRFGTIYHYTKNRFILARQYLPTYISPFYMTVWLTCYFLRAVIANNLKDFLAGIHDGFIESREIPANTLGAQSRVYLQSNYGRLWY